MSTKENSLTLPAPAPLLSRAGWSAFIVALIVVCAVAPVLNIVVPQGSVFHMSDYAVALVGKERTDEFRRYLRMSAGGFRAGMVSLMRYGFRKKY